MFKQEVKQKDGIHIALEGINEYREGEIKRKGSMDHIVKEMRNRNWRDVIHEEFEEKNPWLHQIITDSTRGDYAYLLKADPLNTITLDIGTGWGQSLNVLTEVSKEVWALEGTIDKLRFVQQRARQDNWNNINLINASILDTPFKNDTFDLMSMNGVLEWVPVSDISRDPREIQVGALKECHRIMKNNSQLCIGIENSHGIKYLLGEPDDHTGVKHISYLDREVATEKLMKIRNEEYRTYTYTMSGYIKLLEDAGFDKHKIAFYYPVPSYKIFTYIVPIEKLGLLKTLYENVPSNLPISEMDRAVREKELELIKDKKFDELAESVSSYFIVATK